MDGISSNFVIFLNLPLLVYGSFSGAGGPAHCGGGHSPINIYEGDATQSDNLTTFSLFNYDTKSGIDWTLHHTGHSAMVSVDGSTAVTTSGGGTNGTFKVAQLHFRWGAGTDRGPEHRVSYHAFPMELHIIHHNTVYDSINEAWMQPDGLSVLGFMFESSKRDNSNYTDVVSNLASVRQKGDSAKMSASRLDSLIPSKNLEKFYRYRGSLTTPGCHKTVTWTIFKETIKISPQQLEQFRLMHNAQGAPMVDDISRPVHPIPGRETQASFDPGVQWGYLDLEPVRWKGPAQWKYYYEACGGRHQSPISIPSVASEYDDNIPPFMFKKYEAQEGMTLKATNTGHTVKFSFVGNDAPSISGGGLSETYQAAQFYMHWGTTSSQGSEHRVDNKAYPAELYIVHYKTSLGSLANAVTQPDGVAVLAFLFEVGEESNNGIDWLLNYLRDGHVYTPGTSANLSMTFPLDDLLPADRSDFYRYNGSLTTPQCHETVIWTVFNDRINITEKQLSSWRHLIKTFESEHHKDVDMVATFRPVQPLNGRVVKRNFQIASPHWTYEGPHGVKHWSHDFPICGNVPGVSKQSPIDLVSSKVTFEDTGGISFSGYTNPVMLELSNNGHAVKATVMDGDCTISGGGLPGTYKAAQLSFHWGSSNSRGSEHRVNSRAFPMELHIIHHGTGFRDLGTAAAQPDGLAVLGFMFEISSEDNASLDPIVKQLAAVKDPGSKSDIQPYVTLSNLTDSSLNEFYRYSGSLTSPGCYESVTWIVFRNTIKISVDQLAQFRAVLSNDKEDGSSEQFKPLANNYRPTQPINGRVVYANFKVVDTGAASGVAIGVKVSFAACVLCLIVDLIL